MNRFQTRGATRRALAVVGLVVLVGGLGPMSALQAQPPDCEVRAEAKLSGGDHLAGDVQDRSGETSGRLNHQFPNGGRPLSFAPEALACTISESDVALRLRGQGSYRGSARDVLIEFIAGAEREDGKRQGNYHLQVRDSGRVVFDGNWPVTVETRTVHLDEFESRRLNDIGPLL